MTREVLQQTNGTNVMGTTIAGSVCGVYKCSETLRLEQTKQNKRDWNDNRGVLGMVVTAKVQGFAGSGSVWLRRDSERSRGQSENLLARRE